MADHPYKSQPDHAFWSRAMARMPGDQVDPVVSAPWTLSRDDKIATAGSCFAQHLARRLSALGYNYYVPEDLHAVFDDKAAREQNYRVFSARYGNIYTARQLVQLFRRAHGQFAPTDDHWYDGKAYIDPSRPTAQPGGYATLAELRADRAYHLDRVREMFRELDLFIFTLGLTEAFENIEDGFVYPVCPGVSGGTFDPEVHSFHNFTVDEVADDMRKFLAMLKEVNPNARVLLTVSPVALVATAEPRHVLVSTVYSKSVLRVACDRLEREHDNVTYFPSFEIISGQHSRGQYFAPDLRDVAEVGVDHVMRVFTNQFLDEVAGPDDKTPVTVAQRTDLASAAQEFVEVECEERLLDR